MRFSRGNYLREKLRIIGTDEHGQLHRDMFSFQRIFRILSVLKVPSLRVVADPRVL